MTDATQPTVPITKPSSAPVGDASATQQAQVALVIVMILGLIAIVALSAGTIIAAIAVSKTGNQLAVIIGFAGAFLTLAGTAVGGLVNALAAPSGIANVIANARKTGPLNGQ